MNKRIVLLAAAVVFGFSAASFSTVPFNRDLSVPTAAPAVKDWTIMVFMNGKNNVEKFANMDLQEMEKVGSTDRMNVVVEIGRLKKGTQRLFVKKSRGTGYASQVIASYPSLDMGDYRNAIDFINWAKQTYPAKHYMFVLWNHGLGWIDPVPQKATRGISFDDETHNYIRTRQLGDIMRGVGGVDVFAANACLMQMAEVDYEIGAYTSAIIASEETMLAYGFDYTKLLGLIDSNPNVTPAAIGKSMVAWWGEFMDSIPQIKDVPGTLSIVKPMALKDLPGKLNGFVDAVMAANEPNSVKYAIAHVVRFASIAGPQDKNKMLSSYGDLYDFVRLVDSQSQNPQVHAASRDLMNFITNDLVYSYVGLHTDAMGDDYTKTRGIAIELTKKANPVPPQFDSLMETNYADLALSKASRWDEFINWTNGVWRGNTSSRY